MRNSKGRIPVRAALAAAALVLAPLPLLASPAHAVDDPNVSRHHLYIARVANWATSPSEADVAAASDAAITRWNDEGDGRLVFDRVGVVQSLDLKAATCSPSTDVYTEAKALPGLKGVDWSDRAHNHLVVFAPKDCRTESIGTNPVDLGLDRGGSVLLAYSKTRAVTTLMHELGHNFGLGHAGSWRCLSGQPCANDEYGDYYTPMGASMAYDAPAFDSFDRVSLGLAGADEVRSLSLPAGQRVRTFDLDLRPRGASDGLRGLQITNPAGGTWYVDFRNGAGLDAASLSGTDPNSSWNEYRYSRGITIQKVGQDAKGRQVTELQPVVGSDGVKRYARTSGESYRTDTDGDGKEIGITVEVGAMQLTKSVDDLAHVKVTLTNENNQLFEQTGSLSISGRGGVGDTMTATPSDWTAGSMLRYSWFSDGVVIPGAVGSTYVIPEELQGHRLSAQVTGTQESYQDRTVSSNEVVVGQGLQRFLVEGATYEIRSVESNRLLSDPGYKTAGLTQVAALSAPAGGSTGSQRWTVNSVNADGTFRLQNQAVTTKCLDNAAAKSDDGNATIEYACHIADNQRWKIVGSGLGYTLVNLGSSKSVAPATGAEGSLVVQSSGSYAWRFVRVQ